MRIGSVSTPEIGSQIYGRPTLILPEKIKFPDGSRSRVALTGFTACGTITSDKSTPLELFQSCALVDFCRFLENQFAEQQA
jgi:hypothetical protein